MLNKPVEARVEKNGSICASIKSIASSTDGPPSLAYCEVRWVRCRRPEGRVYTHLLIRICHIADSDRDLQT